VANIRNKTIGLTKHAFIIVFLYPKLFKAVKFGTCVLGVFGISGHCLFEKKKFNEIILNFIVSKF